MGAAEFSEGDIPGPLTVAVSGENAVTGARLIVIGDVDFASDIALRREAYFNLDLFVNSLNWLAEEEQLINIQPRSSTLRTFTPQAALLQFLIVAASLCCAPGIVLLVGASIFLRRRQRK